MQRSVTHPLFSLSRTAITAGIKQGRPPFAGFTGRLFNERLPGPHGHVVILRGDQLYRGGAGGTEAEPVQNCFIAALFRQLSRQRSQLDILGFG